MDGAYLAVGLFAREGSFQGSEGTWTEAGVVEDLVEVGCLRKMKKGGG